MKSMTLPALSQLCVAAVLLLGASSECSALQENKIVSKEEAKKLGVELQSSPNGANGIKVWLEFTPKDELKHFTHVDVEIRAGKKCLMFGQLQTSHPTPDRVSVHFSTDADSLSGAVLTIVVPDGLRTIVGYQFPVKDFIDLQKVGLKLPQQPDTASAVSLSGKSRAADDAFVLTTDRTSATDGYWNTDQGYFVYCFYKDNSEKITESDPGVVTLRLGLVEGGRLHPGPYGVGLDDLRIIGQMWLVVRADNKVVLRVPTKPEFDLGNRAHLRAEFNATAELLPRMEVEFEERLKSGNRRIRIPLTAFMKER